MQGGDTEVENGEVKGVETRNQLQQLPRAPPRQDPQVGMGLYQRYLNVCNCCHHASSIPIFIAIQAATS